MICIEEIIYDPDTENVKKISQKCNKYTIFVHCTFLFVLMRAFCPRPHRRTQPGTRRRRPVSARRVHSCLVPVFFPCSSFFVPCFMLALRAATPRERPLSACSSKAPHGRHGSPLSPSLPRPFCAWNGREPLQPRKTLFWPHPRREGLPLPSPPLPLCIRLYIRPRWLAAGRATFSLNLSRTLLVGSAVSVRPEGSTPAGAALL